MIRPATGADLPLLQKLYDETNDIHGQMLPSIYMSADKAGPRPQDEFESVLAQPDSIILVHDAQGTLAGAVEGSLYRTGPHFYHLPYASLKDIVVAQSARNAGIGSELISAFVQWATAHGVSDIRLYVVATNAAAVRLYQRHGFNIVQHEMQRLSAE